MGESAEGRSFLLGFALGVAWRVDAEASRFLIVSRFSLCSRAGAFGLARAAASGLGLSGDDTAGALSPSSGRRIGGTSVGVLEREGGCESAMLRVDVAGVESATAVAMLVEGATLDMQVAALGRPHQNLSRSRTFTTHCRQL